MTDLVPFGRHKGQPWHAMTDWYCCWVAAQVWVRRQYPDLWKYASMRAIAFYHYEQWWD